MDDFLSDFGAIIVVFSLIGFIIGFIMLLAESKRKFGFKLILFSIMGFVIGFIVFLSNLTVKMC